MSPEPLLTLSLFMVLFVFIFVIAMSIRLVTRILLVTSAISGLLYCFILFVIMLWFQSNIVTDFFEKLHKIV